jgi:hypothetical protein
VTALRQHAEIAAGGLVTVNRRLDALLTADEDQYDKLRVLAHAVEILAGALSSVIEPEHLQAIDELLASLDERKQELTVRDAAERLRSHSPEALEQFLREREEAKRAEPWIAPRGTERRPGDRRIPAGTYVLDVDKDGRMWGQTPDRPDDPLARY